MIVEISSGIWLDLGFEMVIDCAFVTTPYVACGASIISIGGPSNIWFALSSGFHQVIVVQLNLYALASSKQID